jgi:subtilisin family serine protease
VTVEDGTKAYGDFSITSNWAVEIPCTTFAPDNGVFYPNECYSNIQGTSMATPHVAAVMALVSSARPALRNQPASLVRAVTSTARSAVNYTQPLSATDTSPGDIGGPPCPTGFCHLGGSRISNDDAYGDGIVDALAALQKH